ncbi:MAG: glycosyltransferase family 2 protein [Candidatus Edwardsbacteria bacterium]|nr:glycosyltransferase family 2 protein [Candidatus Edwardsbacteria bacterium]
MDRKEKSKYISVVILNWNNLSDTIECIDSLLKNVHPVNKIVIVDNGSTDGSGKMLAEKYSKDQLIELFFNEVNEGFSKGVNLGVKKALKSNPDYILLLNNDTVLDRDCIKKMVDACDLNNKCGIAGPRIFYNHKKEIVWQGGGYFNYYTGGNVVPEKNKKPKVYKTNFVSATFLTGCIMLIKTVVFDKIGLLDEDIFFYEEDVDFCLRAVKSGYNLQYVPSAVAWHKVEGIRLTPFAFYNRARSRIIVLRKNFNKIYVAYGILSHFLLFTPYKIYQSINAEKPWETLRAWFKGSIEGLFAKLDYKTNKPN